MTLKRDTKKFPHSWKPLGSSAPMTYGETLKMDSKLTILAARVK